MQFLSLAEVFNANSPTDYRKNISTMGGDWTGFTQDAAQALGDLPVLRSDMSTGMVTPYRKIGEK